MMQEAAKCYARMGEVNMAINLFVDLKQWEEAKVFAAGTNNVDSSDLVRRQAEWAEETNDWKKAAEMFLSAGEPLRGEREQCNETKQTFWKA